MKSFTPNFNAFTLIESERSRKFKWNILIELARAEESVLGSNSASVFTDSFFIFFFFKKQDTVAVWRLSRELTQCCMFGFVSQGQSAGRRLRDVCSEKSTWEITAFGGCQTQTVSEEEWKYWKEMNNSPRPSLH